MNIRERLEISTPPKDPSMSSMPDKPKHSSDASQNSSSQPLKQLSVLLSIQELTKERDQLKQDLKDKEAELQETKELNLTLFSQISELKQTVAQLTEKIESLNESDIQLAEARKLNAIWQKEKEEILAQASKDKEAAEEAKEDASWARYEAANADRKAKERVSDRERYVKEREGDLNRREELLNQEVIIKAKAEYNKIRIIHNIPFLLSLGYGFVVTILFAVLSDPFRTEFLSFAFSIWKYVSGFAVCLWNITSSLHWTIRILICTLSAIVILIIIWKVVSQLMIVLAKYSDTITACVLLFFLAIEVFLSEYLVTLPINLILLYLIAIFAFFAGRAFVQWEDSEKKKDVGLTLAILLIGGFFIWAAFFNNWG